MTFTRSFFFSLFALACSVVAVAKPSDVTPIWAHEIVAEYPHNPAHFTQGLTWHDGQLFESTGLYGRSGVYIKDFKTGDTLNEYTLHRRLFGEGITVHQKRLWQLTWREGVGLIYDLALKPASRFTLTTEGWGLTGDGQRLWMSDGSATLYELSPTDGRIIDRIVVTERGRPVPLLNELEWINGLIFANRFGHDDIVIFSPEAGVVVGRLDLRELRTRFIRPPGWSSADHVLNGIAWREDTQELLVTGKSWPTLFVLQLTWPPAHALPVRPDKQ